MLVFDEYGNRENPTLLLLHGAGVLDTFSAQYEAFNDYHLVVPHLSGAGESAHLPYEPKQMVAELIALMDHLSKEKIGVMGHSLGAQLALLLVTTCPERFAFAIFLSAWVNPSAWRVKMYESVAPLGAKWLHLKWAIRLQGTYWHLTQQQIAYMCKYSQHITPAVYRSFFQHTVVLADLLEYDTLSLPMLAICGDQEIRAMKESLRLLAKNPCCQTIILKRAGHDFVMKKATELHPVLRTFISATMQGQEASKGGGSHEATL